MFPYKEELEKIIKIIGEENYITHDFTISMFDKDQVGKAAFLIEVDCPLRKIKKRANKLGELTKGKDYTYTITLIKQGIYYSETDDRIKVDFDNNLEYTIKEENNQITSLIFSNEVEDLLAFLALNGIDKEDIGDGPLSQILRELSSLLGNESILNKPSIAKERIR